MISKHKWIFIIGILVIAVSVYYLNRSEAAVNHAVRNFDREYFASFKKKKNDTTDLCAIPGYTEKLRKKAFLNSQLKMAATDSVGVNINMKDTTVSLCIKGVVVKKMKIRQSIISPFFKRVNQEALYSSLSEPMTVTGMNATFQKDPFKVKVAPKDSIEAEASLEINTDTADFQSVYFTLETNKNIRFFFAQIEDTVVTDRRAHFYFDLNDRLAHAKEDLKAISSFRIPEYTPFIKIWVPKAEAKVIFYAIPDEGLITLTL